MNDQEYVLGTHDDEIERLGLQHRIWRPRVLEAWGRAGIGTGSRVIDIGAGPGNATADLASIVGPQGEVLAIERSARFIVAAKNLCARNNVRFQQADLMETEIDAQNFDAAWCRWVACFVSSPQKLVQQIAKALRPGGVAIFHEYIDYRTFRAAPRRPAIENFAAEVMASWRAAGGEPDIALTLPTMLRAEGFKIQHTIPHLFAARPGDLEWQWPASFIEVNLQRLLQLGRVKPDWAEAVRRDMAAASADPASIITTPLLLEIIAARDSDR